MTKMRTKVVNDSTHSVKITQFINIIDGNAGLYRVLATLRPKDAHDLSVDQCATYREMSITALLEDTVINIHPILSTDDCSEAAEITIYETLEQTITWRVSKLRGDRQQPSTGIQDKGDFDALRKDASSRIEAIKASCASLEKLSSGVKICPAQCKNLVKACSDGITKMKGTYYAVSENDMWQLYYNKKLGQLINFLYRFLSTLEAIKDLVQACGSQWYRMGLVLSIPLPSHEENLSPLPEENPSPSPEENRSAPLPEENPWPSPKKKTYSKFDLLLKELSWNLDTIHYALQLEIDLELKWNENKCRFVLQRKNVTGGVLESAELGPVESERLVRDDRDHFLTVLQDGSLLTPKNFLLQWASNLFLKSAANRLRDSFAATLKNRLQRDISIQPSKCNSVPNCFWIDLGDLEFRRRLSGHPESSKLVYMGKWYGQNVAIRMLKDATKTAIVREAAVMLKVQHPNIVDFLGCAFTDDAPSPASGGSAGYIVMELMPEDLRALIERRNRLPNQVGGPFPHVVAVDILLQIVGAMIHMHNCDVTHRDLKAANCLVSPRSSSHSKSPVSDLWTVKLIDFETSKELNHATDDHTVNTGTHLGTAPEVHTVNTRTRRRTAPEVHTVNTGTRRWTPLEVFGMKGGPVVAEYDPYSADVYSFGMVCYEVVTGLLPFQDECARDTEIYDALKAGKRPQLPASVSCPEGLKRLMSECWVEEGKRPDFEYIRKALWEMKFQLELQ